MFDLLAGEDWHGSLSLRARPNIMTEQKVLSKCIIYNYFMHFDKTIIVMQLFSASIFLMMLAWSSLKN